jgi:hypothetical protein
MLRPYTRFHIVTFPHLFLYQKFSRFIINTNIIVFVLSSKLLRVAFLLIKLNPDNTFRGIERNERVIHIA